MFCVTVPVGESVDFFRFKMGKATQVGGVLVTDYGQCEVRGVRKDESYDEREAPDITGEFDPSSPIAVNLFDVRTASVRVAIEAPEEILALRSVVNARGHFPSGRPRLLGSLGNYVCAVLHKRTVKLAVESRPAMLSVLKLPVEAEYAREFLLRWLTFRMAAGPDLTVVGAANLLAETFEGMKAGN